MGNSWKVLARAVIAAPNVNGGEILKTNLTHTQMDAGLALVIHIF